MFDVGQTILYSADTNCRVPSRKMIGTITEKRLNYIVIRWFWANFDRTDLIESDEYSIDTFDRWKHRCKILTEKEILAHYLKN